MPAYEVPLSAKAESFLIALAGVTYSMRVVFNVNADCWVLDISTDLGEPVVMGIPLITGADLLAQYAYLGIKGTLICQTDYVADAVPTFTNLGSEGHLYFITS